jgi:hypothetical protein
VCFNEVIGRLLKAIDSNRPFRNALYVVSHGVTEDAVSPFAHGKIDDRVWHRGRFPIMVAASVRHFPKVEVVKVIYYYLYNYFVL